MIGDTFSISVCLSVLAFNSFDHPPDSLPIIYLLFFSFASGRNVREVYNLGSTSDYEVHLWGMPDGRSRMSHIFCFHAVPQSILQITHQANAVC